MIYEIDDKYYVKVGSQYNEIQLTIDDNNELSLSPLKNKIDGIGKTIKPIVFEKEKDNLKKSLYKVDKTKYSNKNKFDYKEIKYKNYK